MKVTAEQYGEICDIVYRVSQGWPLASDATDPYLHTSDVARAAASRIIEILDLDIDDPWEVLGDDA